MSQTNHSTNIFRFLIPCALFAVMSLILGLAVDYFDCNKLTEDTYYKSEYYERTKLSFTDGLTDCKNISQMGSYGQLVLLGLGPLVGSLYYIMYRKNNETTTQGARYEPD